VITSISRLGQLVLERNPEKDTLLENPNSSGNYPLVFCLCVSQDNGDFKWEGVRVEEFDVTKYTKYLFRRGSSRGANFSPTAHLVEVDKTFPNKIIGWFKLVEKIHDSLSEEDNRFFSQLYQHLTLNEENIIKDLSEKGSRSKDGKIITLNINGKYPGEIGAFQKALKLLVNEKDMSISAKNQICSVCGQQKEVVLGNSSPFSFYTIDKPGFISGGFDEARAWRNFPLCLDCKQYLEEGKRQLENQLRFNFYGLAYLLIPTFYFHDPHNKEIVDILTGETTKKIKFNNESRRRLNQAEEDILDILVEANDTLAFSLLFIKKAQSAERIVMCIEEVFPSTLKKLFSAKEETDKTFGVNPDKGYHFGRLREFLSKSNEDKREPDLDKYFLEIVNQIFRGSDVELSFLISFMMKEIRTSFNNVSSGHSETEAKFYWKTRNAIANVIYLAKLNLIKREGIILTETKFESLFNKYGPHLDTPEKRGIFLLGALTQMLLNYQWKERKTNSFRKHLSGLKMGEREIKGLLAKVRNKFEEYGVFYKSRRLVAEEISRLLLSSRASWKISVDEINFYFVCGMNMYRELAELIYENKEELEEVLENDN